MPGLVHIVSGDASFRNALKTSLEQATFEVATYASAHSLLEGLADEVAPGCILLDAQTVAPTLQSRLNERGSILPVIFVAERPNIAATVRAIKAGADDFLIVPVSPDVLLRAVTTAVARHEASCECKSRLDLARARVAALTPREREVFARVTAGKLNKQIAFELGCTVRTVKAHRHMVMEKCNVRTLAELVCLAERAGGVRPGLQRLSGKPPGSMTMARSTPAMPMTAQARTSPPPAFPRAT